MDDLWDAIRAAARQAGLDRLGVTDAAPLLDARRALEQCRAEGLHATMAFTYRNPGRSTDIRRSFPWARCVVVGARAYRVPGAAAEAAETRAGPTGRVAAYAADDHYRSLREALAEVASVLAGDGWRAAVVADSNALVDRAVAQRAGIGWFGKNANLLAPGLGSWFVIGSVVTDAVLPISGDEIPDGCGSCARCIPACPTGAIVAPGVIDARRCLAWVVQADGDLPEELRTAIGDRLYGCDDCQTACPPSTRAAVAGVGRSGALATGPMIDILEMLSLGDAELLARFGAWYVPRRDPDLLRRNAVVVLANTADGRDRRVVETLRRLLASPSGIVVRHARWACHRLGIDPDALQAATAGDAEAAG